jgi:LPS O-antigen subunit length determinant protein (WzzB/FepE family)
MNENDMQTNSEVDLLEFIKILWRGKITIVVFFLMASFISVHYSLSLPNKYQSTILIAPADSSSFESSLSRYSGLAGLAGVSLPSESNQSVVALAVLKSRKFTENFIDSLDILIPLMAAKEWSVSEQKLLIDEDIYSQSQKKWTRKAEFPKVSKPSIHEAYDMWRQQVFSINEDKKTGFATITITHQSPLKTKEWASLLIYELNNHIRDLDVIEAERSIEYLTSEANKTNSEDLKKVLYSLIQSSTEKKMLAFARPQYLFKVIDPPIMPEKKASPRRSVICIIGAFLGVILGSLIVFMMHFYREHYKNLS